MERCLDALGVAKLAASRTALSQLIGLLSTYASYDSVANAVNSFNQSISPQVFANLTLTREK